MAAVGIVAFIVVESRTPSPMLQLAFFRNPTFSGAAFCGAVVSFGMFGTFFFLSLFFQEVQGYTPLQAGLRSLPSTAMIILVAPFAGRLAGRIGSRIPMVVGMTINAFSLFLFTQIHANTSYSNIWPLLALTGLGMAMVMPPMTAAVMGTVPPQRAGMASATSNASREIGGVFGIALLGAIVTHVFSSNVAKAVSGLGLPPAIRDAIVTQASHGSERAAGGTLPPGVNAAALHAAIGDSFVSGMHVAMAVAGSALLAGATVAFFTIRGQQVLRQGMRDPLPQGAPEVATEVECV